MEWLRFYFRKHSWEKRNFAKSYEKLYVAIKTGYFDYEMLPVCVLLACMDVETTTSE